MLVSQTLDKHVAIGAALELMRADIQCHYQPRGRRAVLSVNAKNPDALDDAVVAYWASTRPRTHGGAVLQLVRS